MRTYYVATPYVSGAPVPSEACAAETVAEALELLGLSADHSVESRTVIALHQTEAGDAGAARLIPVAGRPLYHEGRYSDLASEFLAWEPLEADTVRDVAAALEGAGADLHNWIALGDRAEMVTLVTDLRALADRLSDAVGG